MAASGEGGDVTPVSSSGVTAASGVGRSRQAIEYDTHPGSCSGQQKQGGRGRREEEEDAQRLGAGQGHQQVGGRGREEEDAACLAARLAALNAERIAARTEALAWLHEAGRWPGQQPKSLIAPRSQM